MVAFSAGGGGGRRSPEYQTICTRRLLASDCPAMLPRIPPNWGLRIAVFNYSSALREDLKGSAFVTQFLGYHSQRLRHHPYSPLGAPNQWNGVVASSYPTNAGCSCQSRSATSARSFRREQTLLREMGNARTKSRTRNLYDGLRSYSKRRRTTHRKRHVMVGRVDPLPLVTDVKRRRIGPK